ncbi:MAG: AraC family transcriptional regulator [Gammaproteobacteria bacterium]
MTDRLNAICQTDSCIVIARARHAECPPVPRPMMLAAAHGGRESYQFDRRRVAVDDDNFLVQNAGRAHESAIHSRCEVESFKIFFRAGLVEEVLAPLVTPADRLLERPSAPDRFAFEFSETLRPHDRQVSPVLRYIRHQALAGNDDPAWFEEQLGYLLERMLLGQREIVRQVQAIPCARAGTRKEIYRRVTLAVDYIESCYEQSIGLMALAEVACMSKFHFLRAFHSLQGVTPQLYLQRKRSLVAKRLLESTTLPVAEIALRVGYSSPTSLTKQVRHWIGAAPGEIRRRLAQDADSSPTQFRHSLRTNLAIE